MSLWFRSRSKDLTVGLISLVVLLEFPQLFFWSCRKQLATLMPAISHRLRIWDKIFKIACDLKRNFIYQVKPSPANWTYLPLFFFVICFYYTIPTHHYSCALTSLPPLYCDLWITVITVILYREAILPPAPKGGNSFSPHSNMTFMYSCVCRCRPQTKTNGAGVGGEVQGLRPCADLTMSHRACAATQSLISSARADGP